MRNKPILRNNNENIPEFTLQKKYLELIKSGLKTSEGRINSGSFTKLETGQKIKFFENNNPRNFVICEILAINSYDNFAQMLESEGLENMLPGVKTLEDGIKIYENIPSYKERCEQKGCLGIRIKVVKD